MKRGVASFNVITSLLSNNTMKRFFLSLAFLACFSASAFAQCPEGKKQDGGWGTSGCSWPSGCYTDEEIKKGHEFIAKCACGETQFSVGNYIQRHDWKDGSCVTTYIKYVKGKEGEYRKTEISELEFNCSVFSDTYTTTSSESSKTVKRDCSQFKKPEPIVAPKKHSRNARK